jgi:hypothetical protein
LLLLEVGVVEVATVVMLVGVVALAVMGNLLVNL